MEGGCSSIGVGCPVFMALLRLSHLSIISKPMCVRFSSFFEASKKNLKAPNMIFFVPKVNEQLFPLESHMYMVIALFSININPNPTSNNKLTQFEGSCVEAINLTHFVEIFISSSR